MNNFNIYLPLEKAAFPTGAYEKITDFSPQGATRTRYKLKGIASTSTLDRDNEIVSKNCLRMLAGKVGMKKIPIFGNHEHNWENMLGYTNSAEQNENALEILITTDYEETNPKVSQLIGKSDGGLPIALSIGGRVLKDHEQTDKISGKKINVIDDVDLLEVSIVGIGANPDAFLSLPDQIAKSLKKVGNNLKEEIGLPEEIQKFAGQAGEVSYGKLGETTIQARCPKCSLPADLRMVDNQSSHYQCSTCDLHFDVRNPTKEMTSIPYNNLVNPSTTTIDQDQSVLGRKSAEVELQKGGVMETKAEAEKCNKPAEADEDEKAYKSWLKSYERAVKEGVFKAEGVSGTPGSENAAPKNTIGGSGGAATPVHAKSMAGFESMKKAFAEEAGAETLVSEQKTDEKEGTSFNHFRAKMLKQR